MKRVLFYEDRKLSFNSYRKRLKISRGFVGFFIGETLLYIGNNRWLRADGSIETSQNFHRYIIQFITLKRSESLVT